MKKPLIISIILVLTLFLFIGCDAKANINSDKSTTIKLTFNRSMAREYGFDLDEYTSIEDFQSYLIRELSYRSSTLNMTVESYKKDNNFWNMRINIPPNNTINYSSILGKYAVGTAEDIIVSFGSFRYGSENLITTTKDLLSSIENNEIHAYDYLGTEQSTTAVELMLEDKSLKNYSAVYTNQDIMDMKYVMPGNIELILTNNQGFGPVNKKTIMLSDKDFALVVYKQPKKLLPLWIVLAALAILITLSRFRARKNRSNE